MFAANKLYNNLSFLPSSHNNVEAKASFKQESGATVAFAELKRSDSITHIIP